MESVVPVDRTNRENHLPYHLRFVTPEKPQNQERLVRRLEVLEKLTAVVVSQDDAEGLSYT